MFASVRRCAPTAYRVFCCLLLTLATREAQAQGPGRPTGAPGGLGGPPGTPAAAPAIDLTRAPRVFLDCNRCDFDFFRVEIPFANFVRDRFDSDVHVLVTTLQAANRGTEFTITFLGQKSLRGAVDTLVFSSNPNDSDDIIRNGLAARVRLGLVRWASRTPLADQITIGLRGVNPRAQLRGTQNINDPWNFWLFRANVNGNGNAEQLAARFNTSGGLNAQRITEAWKIDLGVTGAYNFQRAELSGGREFRNVQRTYGANALAVKSLGEHWSAGLRSQYIFSDFFNQDLSFTVAPAVEWNYFPWREATRRQLTVQYSIGVNHYEYQRPTIFNQTVETRFNQTLLTGLTTIQRWGNIRSSLELANYLHDFDLFHATFSTGVELRLGRGLSINVNGTVSSVRDQIYLARAGQSDNEIIVNRQALPTTFRISYFAGMSYTFGSIYNTVVNPRFGQTGRRGVFIQF